MFPKWSDWNIQYTRKGLLKRRISQTLRVLVLAAVIVGAYSVRKDIRVSLYMFQNMFRVNIKSALFEILRLAQKGVNMIPE